MNRAMKVAFPILVALLIGCGFFSGALYEQRFCKSIIKQYADYNIQLHEELGSSAEAYDNAIKQVWQLEAELDYYKPSYQRLKEAYNHLLRSPKEVVVEKEVFLQLDYFETLEELEAWLAQDNVDKLKPSHPDFDCDDFAYALQRHAARAGYFISTEIIRQKGRNHMINSALIGDEIYFIEPAADEVWFKCRRD